MSVVKLKLYTTLRPIKNPFHGWGRYSDEYGVVWQINRTLPDGQVTKYRQGFELTSLHLTRDPRKFIADTLRQVRRTVALQLKEARA